MWRFSIWFLDFISKLSIRQLYTFFTITPKVIVVTQNEAESIIQVKNKLMTLLSMLRDAEDDGWIDQYDEQSVNIRSHLEECLLLLRGLKDDEWRKRLRGKIYEALFSFYQI